MTQARITAKVGKAGEASALRGLRVSVLRGGMVTIHGKVQTTKSQRPITLHVSASCSEELLVAALEAVRASRDPKVPEHMRPLDTPVVLWDGTIAQGGAK